MGFRSQVSEEQFNNFYVIKPVASLGQSVYYIVVEVDIKM